ncbi:hypothetical protein [Micromonospora olivasterospora]|uniref:Uncharacterized protein n=1 Tax=Micromonospora olivasterospora TaxID=1880 RepID=A0A562I5V5_MICOL|nr:hypothetical protein [Micromonospora olivasterospora]TWH66342.1 hypothetical protein JD77_01294 [Micromonospora olivasterospora]
MAGAAALATTSLLVPALTGEPAPPPGALPMRTPAVATSSVPAPAVSPIAAPSSQATAATRAPARTRPAPPPVATTTPPAPVSDARRHAADRVDRLIDDGVASGEIRSDVGTDLRSLLGHATAARGEDDLALAVRRARDEVAEQRRGGSISKAYARQLDAAFRELGATDA